MATKAKAPTPDAAPLTPEAVVTLTPLQRKANERADAVAKVEAKAKALAEAEEACTKVRNDPKSTPAQRDAAWDAVHAAKGGGLDRAEYELEIIERDYADLEKAANDEQMPPRPRASGPWSRRSPKSWRTTTTRPPTTYARCSAIWNPREPLCSRCERATRLVTRNGRSIEKYLPKDAKGYPVIPASDGSVAGGIFAECLYEAGGTLNGVHPLILASDFDTPPPSRDDPYGFKQFLTIVGRYGESLGHGKRMLAMHGKEHLAARCSSARPRYSRGTAARSEPWKNSRPWTGPTRRRGRRSTRRHTPSASAMRQRNDCTGRLKSR